VNVTKISDDKFHLNLVVENDGFLPTFTSQQSKTRRSSRPVRLELEIPTGALMTSGKPREELGHLEGRSNKLDNDAPFGESPTDNRRRIEWVIQATPGTKIKLKILSERAGSIQREIILQ
jgi:hypothetical protein